MWVNAESYLEMLLTVTWSAVGNTATRKQYWFRRTVLIAMYPCTTVMNFLRSKFNDRIISRGSAHRTGPYTLYSPDLSCPDFSFWPQGMDCVVESEPETVQDLKNVVEDFTSGISEKQPRKIARHTRRWAELCVAERGGYFEHLL